MKKGDKFRCNETLNNVLGWPLFKEGDDYTVLEVDEQSQTVVLNHILYANEYSEFPIDFINENFSQI